MKTREDFTAAVLKRDKNQCVICGAKEMLAVHHIIDRSLFPTFEDSCQNDNGVTLCENHHWDAERGEVSCVDLRLKAKIKTIVVPDGYDVSKPYDKWCNEFIVDRKPMGEFIIKINDKSLDSFERVCKRNSQVIRLVDKNYVLKYFYVDLGEYDGRIAHVAKPRRFQWEQQRDEY